MKTFLVTMKVTTDEGNPGKWEWSELIGDECELISVKEV